MLRLFATVFGAKKCILEMNMETPNTDFAAQTAAGFLTGQHSAAGVVRRWMGEMKMPRYIDANKFARYASAATIYDHLTIYMELARFPTEDVAPVIHGKWLPTKNEFMGDECFECSNCGYTTIGCDYKYCSNCGAKMGEKEQE